MFVVGFKFTWSIFSRVIVKIGTWARHARLSHGLSNTRQWFVGVTSTVPGCELCVRTNENQWKVVSGYEARCELCARTNENLWVSTTLCTTDGDCYKYGCQGCNGQTTTMARRKRKLQPTTTQLTKRRHIRFPCVICKEAVRHNQAALACDGCDKWQHLDCQSGI